MDRTVEQRTMAKVAWRLLPLIVIIYFVAYIDRTNVGFAAISMNKDLGFNAYIYWWGAGIFFLGYALFEVPSNVILHRVGARVWIARIISALFLAVPGSNAAAAAISGAILQLDGVWGIAGWKWMFMLESLPAIL